MADRMDTCASCRFYDSTGECRKSHPIIVSPPSPLLPGMGYSFGVTPKGQWPGVLGTDWCGDYEPRRR